MNKAKYIIAEVNGLPTPFVFPEWVTHANVAMLLNVKPVAAGFTHIAEDKFVCYGDSVSLKIGARAEDSSILTRTLGGWTD